MLEITDQTPAGVVVAEGVWWLEFAPGTRSVNALTSQRLTDQGQGSTFYDTRIEVGKATDQEPGHMSVRQAGGESGNLPLQAGD
jgi:hypothetical protein